MRMKSVVAACVVAAMATGCANNGKQPDLFGTGDGAKVGTMLGCAAGLAVCVGVLHLRGPESLACIGIACAAGNYFGHKADLEEARKLEEKYKTTTFDPGSVKTAQAAVSGESGKPKSKKAANVQKVALSSEKIVIHTETAHIKDPDDTTKKIAAWKSSDFELPKASLASRTDQVKSYVEDLGKFSAGRGEPVKVVVYASTNDQAAIKGWLQTGFSQQSNPLAKYNMPKPTIEEKTISGNAKPRVTIAPVDQKQFTI